MKHSFIIDSQRKHRSQWKRLLETVTLLMGRLSVVIATVLFLIGLSLIFAGPSNIAHAKDAKYTNQDKIHITSNKEVNQNEQGLQRDGDRHGEHKHGEHRHGEHEHGEHEHGEHRHGEHEHGEHKHGEHKHGEHEK